MRAIQRLFKWIIIFSFFWISSFFYSLTDIDASEFNLLKSRKNSIAQIFLQPSRPTREGLCFSRLNLNLPASLDILKRILSGQDSVDASYIRSYLAALSKRNTDARSEIDEKSKFYQETQKMGSAGTCFRGQEKVSRFCGAELNNMKLIEDKKLKEFLESLFEAIEAESVQWNPTVLSRADLFHAHVVYNRDNKDLVIVFHSKEYPNGEPSMEDGFPRRRFLDYFGESLGSGYHLANPTDRVTRRNFAWSLNENRLCGIDVTQAAFRGLSTDLNQSYALDPSKVTGVGESGEIANIDYFSKEGVPIYFDFHRGFGDTI
jgi:hypothetical protein